MTKTMKELSQVLFMANKQEMTLDFITILNHSTHKVRVNLELLSS